MTNAVLSAFVAGMLGAIFQATGNSPPMVNAYKKSHGVSTFPVTFVALC